MTVDRVPLGGDVALVVDASGGDGQDVAFRVTTADGAELVRLTAPIAAGTARATWRVDVGDRPLPIDVRFEAASSDGPLTASTLTVTAPGQLGAVGVVALPADALRLDPGQLGELCAGPAPAPTPAIDSYGSTQVSDLRAIIIDVAAPRRQPLAGEFALSLRLERETEVGRDDWRPERTEVRVWSGAAVRQLHVGYRSDRVGHPERPRRRVTVAWQHRPGEAATPDAEREPRTVELP